MTIHQLEWAIARQTRLSSLPSPAHPRSFWYRALSPLNSPRPLALYPTYDSASVYPLTPRSPSPTVSRSLLSLCLCVSFGSFT